MVNRLHKKKLSIEVLYVSVGQVEAKQVKFTQKGAIFTRFSGFTEPEVAGRNRKYQISTQLIKPDP